MTDDQTLGEPQETPDLRTRTAQLFRAMAAAGPGTPGRTAARDGLVALHMPLVEHLARRFRNRGEPYDDLVQVATIGLIKAIDRFDLTREVQFASFAVPYIVGEIKRHYRDTSWAVHVPRRLQEARVELARAAEELGARLGRSPRVAELAEHMDLTEEEVVEARLASNGYTSMSLDAAIGDDENDDVSLAHFIGEQDHAVELFEDFHTLAPLLERLGERDRRLLHLRFVEELTQSEIGKRLGVSQMQVSRLLAGNLARLREGMLAR